MKRVNVTALVMALAIVAVLSTQNAFAYGEDIQSNLTNLLNWITKILGGIAVGFGITWTGIRVSMQDEHALGIGMKIVGGGILMFSSMSIVNLLQSIFK